jgi:hypothetical protein
MCTVQQRGTLGPGVKHRLLNVFWPGQGSHGSINWVAAESGVPSNDSSNLEFRVLRAYRSDAPKIGRHYGSVGNSALAENQYGMQTKSLPGARLEHAVHLQSKIYPVGNLNTWQLALKVTGRWHWTNVSRISKTEQRFERSQTRVNRSQQRKFLLSLT